jgi:Gpi18-like mannosyltransferase
MIKKIFGLFLAWRIGLFIIAFIATFVISNFGGRFPYYDLLLIPTGLPSWIWGFGNFDGVHYLRIALMGYESSQFSQAFFPLYPLMIKLLTVGNFSFLTALIMSNFFFAISLYLFYQLMRMDYSEQTSFKSLILLVFFPTSFYFGAVYSESLFLFLTLAALFLLRNKKYLAASLYAGLSSATRIFGLILIPVFALEIYSEIKNKKMKIKSEEFIKAVLSIFIIPLGTTVYMWYLKIGFSNPLYFLSSQSAFGAQRSENPFILLPQVLFRYLKMFLAIDPFSLSFFNIALELIFFLVPFIFLIFAYKKIRFSYWIFILGCLLLPTLTGTLSSMPRYVLMIFLLLPFIVENIGKYFKITIGVSTALAIILVSLFIRGYWIA